MRISILSKIINVVTRKGNLRITLFSLAIHILLMIGSFLIVRQFFGQPPCAVCGRVNTKPVHTLWQYRSKPIPYVEEKNIWYCKRHIKNAPEIVLEIPSHKDTASKRFWIMVATSTISLFTLIFTLAVIDSSFYSIAVHPVSLAASFILFGITGSGALTFSIVTIFAFPLVIFLVWQKWGYKNSVSKRDNNR